MKLFRLVALLLAVLVSLTACSMTKTPSNTPDAPVAEATPPATPDPASNIPPATTEQKPTKEGETYSAVGMYLGMADNNLLVMVEANPEDGKPEKSYHISSEFNLEAMGITEGSVIELTYTVDENGFKKVKTIETKH